MLFYFLPTVGIFDLQIVQSVQSFLALWSALLMTFLKLLNGCRSLRHHWEYSIHNQIDAFNSAALEDDLPPQSLHHLNSCPPRPRKDGRSNKRRNDIKALKAGDKRTDFSGQKEEGS